MLLPASVSHYYLHGRTYTLTARFTLVLRTLVLISQKDHPYENYYHSNHPHK